MSTPITVTVIDKGGSAAQRIVPIETASISVNKAVLAGTVGFNPSNPTDYSSVAEYSFPGSGRPSAGRTPTGWSWMAAGMRFTGSGAPTLREARVIGPLFHRAGTLLTMSDVVVDARTPIDGGLWNAAGAQLNTAAVDAIGSMILADNSSFFYTIDPANKGGPVAANKVDLSKVELWGGSLACFPTSNSLIDKCWSHHRQMRNVHGDAGCHVNHFYFSGGTHDSFIQETLIDYSDLVDLSGTSEPNGVTSNVFCQGSGPANGLIRCKVVHANKPGIGNGGNGGIQPNAVVNQDSAGFVIVDTEFDPGCGYANRVGSPGTLDVVKSHGNYATGGGRVPVVVNGSQSPPITVLP